MKSLHLLRHAKSAWDQPQLSDRERGLNRRGKRDAPRMGSALAQRLAPMKVHVSPARRALLTLDGLCEGWPELGEIEHRTVEELYSFASEDIFQWLRGLDENCTAVFIISHNPALTDLVNDLLGAYCLDNLPTAGYVALVLQIDQWRDLLHGCAMMEQTLFPKQLPDA